VVARGEVWWIDFGDPQGSEPAFRRPAVVVSSDRFNASRINTVIVSAITSNLKLAQAPGNVGVDANVGGLSRDSVVNVSQTMVVDRSRLENCTGTLPSMLMQQVDDGLRLVLAL